MYELHLLKFPKKNLWLKITLWEVPLQEGLRGPKKKERRFRYFYIQILPGQKN